MFVGVVVRLQHLEAEQGDAADRVLRPGVRGGLRPRQPGDWPACTLKGPFSRKMMRLLLCDGIVARHNLITYVLDFRYPSLISLACTSTSLKGITLVKF
jgi:hypothetical protein